MSTNAGSKIESGLVVLLMMILPLVEMLWYARERRHFRAPEQEHSLKNVVTWSVVSGEASGLFFLSLMWWQVLFHDSTSLRDAGFIVTASLLIFAVLSGLNSYRLNEKLQPIRE